MRRRTTGFVMMIAVVVRAIVRVQVMQCARRVKQLSLRGLICLALVNQHVQTGQQQKRKQRCDQRAYVPDAREAATARTRPALSTHDLEGLGGHVQPRGTCGQVIQSRRDVKLLKSPKALYERPDVADPSFIRSDHVHDLSDADDAFALRSEGV